MSGSPQLRIDSSALRVDVDQNIHFQFFKFVNDRFAQGAVMVSVHLCVLQKFSRFRDALAEIRLGKKLIILAIDLAGSRRTRGAGDGINKDSVFDEVLRTSVVLPAPDGAETTKRIP